MFSSVTRALDATVELQRQHRQTLVSHKPNQVVFILPSALWPQLMADIKYLV